MLFLVPARLHPQKNPLGVIEAMETVLKKKPACPARIAFAGKGKAEEEAKAHAADSAHPEAFRFLGQRDDMLALYNAADAVVLSSFKEGFSNAVVEALACGKPVIASDVGGNREAINERRFGWIHDAGDTQALAGQLTEACEIGRKGLTAMAADCRARAECFSVEELVRQTDILYRKALEGRT